MAHEEREGKQRRGQRLDHVNKREMKVINGLNMCSLQDAADKLSLSQLSCNRMQGAQRIIRECSQ